MYGSGKQTERKRELGSPKLRWKNKIPSDLK
jgi:hypothetical protein